MSASRAITKVRPSIACKFQCTIFTPIPHQKAPLMAWMVSTLKYPADAFYYVDTKGKKKKKTVLMLRTAIEQILASCVIALTAAIQEHVDAFKAPPLDISAIISEMNLHDALGMRITGQNTRQALTYAHFIARIDGINLNSQVAKLQKLRLSADSRAIKPEDVGPC
jgi:hypothetical protein